MRARGIGPMMCVAAALLPQSALAVTVENEAFAVEVDPGNGAITSLVVKELGCDLIGEKRLAANFRIGLPLPDYQCHYIEGTSQKAESVVAGPSRIDVVFPRLVSERGAFPIRLEYSIVLEGDAVYFRSKLTNGAEFPVAEFWFPRIGGWTQFGNNRDALLATPNYIGCGHGASLFRGFPGGRGLGAEAAEFATNYPGMVMP